MSHREKKVNKFKKMIKKNISGLLTWIACEGSSKCKRCVTMFKAYYLLHNDIAKFKARKKIDLMQSYCELEEEFKSGSIRNCSYDLKRMGDYD